MHNATKLIGAAALTLLCAQPLWAKAPARPSPAVARPAAAAVRRIGAALGNAGPSPFMMLLRTAHLTRDQQIRIRRILHSQAVKNRPLFQQMRATREEIADELLGAGAVSAGDLAPLERRQTQLRRRIGHNLIDTSLAIRGVLTSDQLSHLAEVHRRLDTLRTRIENLLGAPLSSK